MAKIGMLIDLHFCIGCQACEAACVVANDLPPGVTWLKVIRNTPEEVDGKLVLDYIPMPRSLAKCAECFEREEGQPLCSKVCVGKALFVESVDELIPRAQERRSLLWSPV